jgi:tRNA pseudouridine55 synthase
MAEKSEDVMTRRSGLREVIGIILLDKPLGMTSNAALQTVKRLFFAKKAGHTGSLDPLASGLLPLCFGDATKVSAYLLDADKRYRVTIKLGVKTTTGDAEGEVVATRAVGDIEATELQAVIKRFTGVIQQIPPMHSAIKYQGQPLYKLAHNGIEVERQAREIEVHELSLLSYEADSLKLEVACSKGTYIRTLAEDIGEALGTGAHVVELRRTATGPFRVEQMVSLSQLEAAAAEGFASLDKFLLPMETALEHWPDVCLSDDLAFHLRRGQAVFVPRAPTQGWVKLLTADQRFLGVGRVLDDGRVAPKRIVSGVGS